MAVAMAVVLGAGIVRGFAGFGFSALTVAGTALIVSPSRIVPAVFVLEVLASVTLMRAIWHDIDWKWLWPLLIGNALTIPLGVAALAVVPEAPLRAMVSTVILVAALLLLAGVRAPWPDGRAVRFGTGIVSGLFNGIAAIGGMVVAVMLFSTTIAAAAARATLIAMFLATDLYSLAWAGGNGLIDRSTALWALWLAIPMVIGIAIGHRRFIGVDEARFRRAVLILLATIATLGLVRAALT